MPRILIKKVKIVNGFFFLILMKKNYIMKKIGISQIWKTTSFFFLISFFLSNQLQPTHQGGHECKDKNKVHGYHLDSLTHALIIFWVGNFYTSSDKTTPIFCSFLPKTINFKVY